jgi:hypothetical protein
MEQSFSLVPFPAPNIPAIAIIGRTWFRNNILDLQYILNGAVEQVVLLPPSVVPSRRDELWKATCFEFFLAIKDEPGYWEFNMSPSGDWNVYRMDAYRRIGFRQETAIAKLPFRIKKEFDIFSLNLSVDLSFALRPEGELQMGVTAIIQTKDRNETFWALTHPAPDADFHLRESFLFVLAGQAHPAQSSAAGA